jgi:arsenical-resistance protein 2
MASSTNSSNPSLPWHAAYPTPRSTPASIRREELLDMMERSAESSSRDYVLLDLRRNDYQVMFKFGPTHAQS